MNFDVRYANHPEDSKRLDEEPLDEAPLQTPREEADEPETTDSETPETDPEAPEEDDGTDWDRTSLTPEQEAQLRAVIDANKHDSSRLMGVMQEAQGIYGYLPIEVQKIIADKTGIPAEQIYGVVSFYSQFKLNPDGEVAVAVCLGTACYVKGSGDIIEECSRILNVAVGSTSADGRYSLEATRCIGACGLAPVLTINGDVYGRLVPDQIPEILAKYRD